MSSSCNRGTINSQNTEPITTIILVRHAEKIGETDELDPVLGLNRSQELARMYSNSSIQHIYSSNYNRTIKTAQPLADLLGLQINLYSTDNLAILTQKIKSEHKGEVILVIGHSNTIPKTIQLLDSATSFPDIPSHEYDNLYTVILTENAKTKVIKKKYGLKSPTKE
ncbi:MAG: histidine phosphatase family protein [Saprospiraceae bacterium]|nr:histidine phosphatase family protein [Saprospiraceae bacterium]MBK9630811.1 histidine phosphatase family protein [Saprospiraceae bacterium]